jgi:Gpi18-like mannosyltransferase
MSPARPGILLPFLATRGGLLLVGVLAHHLLVSGLTLQKGNLRYHAPGPAVLEVWARWDAEWYLLIAERGYRPEEHVRARPAEPGARTVAYEPADATGFFPLYPFLIRLLTLVGLPSLLAGVLVSNLALLGALWFLRDLASRDHGEEAAGRAVWILLAFPTSFFLSAVYAESLMLLGLLGSLWAAREDRPWLAGLFGGLCVLSRPTGVLVLLPLLDETALRRPRAQGLRGIARIAAPLALPLLALGGYMLYCRALFGSLTPFLLRQERWRGASSGPWRAFVRYFESPRVHDAHHSTIDLLLAVILVASIPLLFRLLRRSHALYATAAILLPLCSTLWSYSRFAATLFPVHLAAALLAAEARGRFAALLAVCLPLSGLFMALYAAWWWVG